MQRRDIAIWILSTAQPLLFPPWLAWMLLVMVMGLLKSLLVHGLK